MQQAPAVNKLAVTPVRKRKPPAPSVFISYSHDSKVHKEWVLLLAESLMKRGGIMVLLDEWDTRHGTDMAKFMERSVAEADRVLLICTENYVTKIDNGQGGAGYEGMIVTGELLRDLDSVKFIPVVRQTKRPFVLPRCLTTRKYIDFSSNEAFEVALELLVREIQGVPKRKKPELGPNPFSLEKESLDQRTAQEEPLSLRDSAISMKPKSVENPESRSVNFATTLVCPKCGGALPMPGAQCDNCGLVSFGIEVRREEE